MEARMDITTPLVVGILLAVFTAIQAWLMKDRFDKMDARFAKQDERIDRLEDRMERGFEAVSRRFDQQAAEIAGIRSDLTQIALALGLRARPETG
jgi:hypothetical protein